VNTIVIERDGKEIRARGMNTDYAAILDSITRGDGIARDKLAGEKVAIFGAGGTEKNCRGGAGALWGPGVVYNRTRDRADALAAEFEWQERAGGRGGNREYAPVAIAPDFYQYDIAGHEPEGWMPSPLDGISGAHLARNRWCLIRVYNPMRTKFIRLAQEAGAKTILGDEMFLRQAAAQFEAWTKKTGAARCHASGDPAAAKSQELIRARLFAVAGVADVALSPLFFKIFLVVILGGIKGAGGSYLRDDGVNM